MKKQAYNAAIAAETDFITWHEKKLLQLYESYQKDTGWYMSR